MPSYLASCLFVKYLVRVPVYDFRVFSGWYCVRGSRVDYPVYFLGVALVVVGMYSGMCLCVLCIFLYCIIERVWQWYCAGAGVQWIIAG